MDIAKTDAGTVGRSRRALVVDDEPDVREMLSNLLEDAGWQVVAAEDGLEAWKRLSEGERPDVIILDMLMPRADGWQFRKLQLADRELASIPVVVTSCLPLARNSVLRSGAASFLAKPYPPDLLLTELSKIPHSPLRPAPPPGS